MVTSNAIVIDQVELISYLNAEDLRKTEGLIDCILEGKYVYSSAQVVTATVIATETEL